MADTQQGIPIHRCNRCNRICRSCSDLGGVDGVIGIFSSVLGLLNLQSASVFVGGFPNVLISVAEMQAPNMLGAGMNSMFLANTNGFINGIGGIAVFFAALIVLYILVSRSWKFRNVRQNLLKFRVRPKKGKGFLPLKKTGQQLANSTLSC